MAQRILESHFLFFSLLLCQQRARILYASRFRSPLNESEVAFYSSGAAGLVSGLLSRGKRFHWREMEPFFLDSWRSSTSSDSRRCR
ncbi:hypothetical protein JCGZ_09515 [Jatropha curcas]|uniref:Uncharacterized protein n=1 Tax=Jatropha curcas TaxID=180498 RepID=A0A067KVZ5_JATCU|nr:hypothetical protein JCGZ_09515 [Jatropha curcas]